MFTRRSVLPLLGHQCGVIHSPIYMEAHKLSDHAPSLRRFSVIRRLFNKAPRISFEWCEHPAYSSRLLALCDAANVNSHPVTERSIGLKDFAREAARHARDVMFECTPESKVATLLRLSSITLAVWSGHPRLHSILIRESHLGSEPLELRRGIPVLRNHIFEEDYGAAKLEAAREREAATTGEHDVEGRTQEFDKASCTNGVKRNADLVKLWTISLSAFVTRGVRLFVSGASDCGIDVDATGVTCDEA